MSQANDNVAELRKRMIPLAAAGLGRRTSAKLVGVEAATLGALLREGYPVHDGWVIPTTMFERALEQTMPRGHSIASLIRLADTRAGIDRAARVYGRILSQPLPDDLVELLAHVYEDLSPGPGECLAVRASTTSDETVALDGGLTEIVGVRGVDALQRAVRQVWANAAFPRHLGNLARASVRDCATAVIIQRRGAVGASGVLYTQPPLGLTGRAWQMSEGLIQATTGSAPVVVDGAAAVDTFRFAREGGAIISRSITDKDPPLLGEDEDVEARPPSLSTATVRELIAIADRLNERDHERGAAALAFTVEAGLGGTDEVRITSLRPMRTRGFPEGGKSDTVWLRASLGEMLTGAATPLTWSTASATSTKSLRTALEALGCHVPGKTHLITDVQGRFYLNLTALMRIVAQVPGLGPARLLAAGGGASHVVAELLEQQVADHSESKRRFITRLAFAARRLVSLQTGLEGEVSAFEEDATRMLRRLRDLDLPLLPDDSIATTLKSAQALLDRTSSLMLRAASASLLSHFALGETLALRATRHTSARSDEAAAVTSSSQRAHAERDRIEAIVQRLTSGIIGLETTSPSIALADVARVAPSDPAARAVILAGARTLDDLPAGPLRSALDHFIAEHGDRALREAELLTPRWSEDPADALAMLASLIRDPYLDPERALSRARAGADRETARLEGMLTAIEMRVLRAFIGHTQRFARIRETLRTWQTRELAVLRAIAIDVDRRLCRIDPSVPQDAAFYCTFDELTLALASGHAELGTIVRLRRAEHRADEAHADPPVTFVGHPPPLPLAPPTRLYGLAASSGVVEGRARVLRPGSMRLDALRSGEILVVRSTDVALSPLFLVAGGVVTEFGGPLSHAAFVARQFGVPAVVDVQGATTTISDGERVRVDGDTGIVVRITEAAADQPAVR